MLGLGNSISSAALMGGGIESISDMELWLKNGVGVTAAQWDDSSGNDNHATQGTEANQADVSGGGLDFETVDADSYALGSTITIAENGRFTMAWVMQTESTSNATVIADGANEVVQFQNGNKFKFSGNNPSNLTSAIYKGSRFDPDEKMLITFTRDGDGDLLLYKNGAVITPHSGLSSNLTNDRGFDLTQIGAKASSLHLFDGIIYELLVFSKLLDADELSTLHTELLGKHGL